jgi:deoxyribodipyrimidine photo-lyase
VTEPRHEKALVWLRRDLRVHDHAALYHALKSARGVYCVYVFDTEILDALERRADRRLEFIWESVVELRAALDRLGGGLIVRHGRARIEIPALARELGVQAVFANHDYEPAAVDRDAVVARALAAEGRELRTFKDQVIFEKDEVLTRDGRPFSVFTAYKNAWLDRADNFYFKAYPVEHYARALLQPPASSLPTLEHLGFQRTNLKALRLPTGASGARALFADFRGRMAHYHERRDYPAVKGPSYLSVHLRFGTIKPALDAIAFPNDERLFRAWCDTRTGYPLVDAAMRQINQSGYMHNRLRMVTASFLVNDLLVDWR